MGFAIDGISLGKLRGVHPDLIRVVQRCAENANMAFTFGVSEGLRTFQQQRLDVAAGKSQTLASRHLDGHAVDLVVLVNNQVTWSWPPYYLLADAMRQAAVDTRIPVTWGGCWDKEMASYTDTAAHESAAYVLRSKDRGGHGFVDGPHFELPKSKYISGAYTPGIRTA
jgi:peptidoglycan L-alanyl-D-glutamate endopeptidase CwlK